jgi:hypothetical protein
MSRRPRPFVRECFAASVAQLIILQIEYGFASTTSESAAHYQYVIIPTLLYTNVSLHRPARPSRASRRTQTVSTVDPVVLRAARSAWALAASFSG